jgi:hypothetical protein
MPATAGVGPHLCVQGRPFLPLADNAGGTACALAASAIQHVPDFARTDVVALLREIEEIWVPRNMTGL